MDRILAILNTIPVDKLLHFFVGFVLSSILIPLFDWVGLIMVVFVAASKEVFFDHYLERGRFEVADFVWTIIPAVLVYAIKSLYLYI